MRERHVARERGGSDGIVQQAQTVSKWCAACSSNVGSAKSAVEQHCKGQEHLRKVQRKIDGSDRGTKIIESIQAYKDIVKDSTGGQEAVGFERVALNVQVHQQLYNINYLLPNYSV